MCNWSLYLVHLCSLSQRGVCLSVCTHWVCLKHANGQLSPLGVAGCAAVMGKQSTAASQTNVHLSTFVRSYQPLDKRRRLVSKRRHYGVTFRRGVPGLPAHLRPGPSTHPLCTHAPAISKGINRAASSLFASFSTASTRPMMQSRWSCQIWYHEAILECGWD